MGEKKILNRREWLLAHGYREDPFLPASFHAELDNHLKTCYIDTNDIEYLIGEFNKPGYRLIFSKTGGGKSGIRKRIHWEYEKIGKPKVLILDYVDHDYPPDESTIYDHINRIFALAEKSLNVNYGLKRIFRKERSLAKNAPKTALRALVNICRKLGFLGIYILVDNVTVENFDNIAPLALFEVRGLIFKFFLSENLLLVAQSTPAFRRIPRYIIKWNKADYVEFLNQRLAKCLDVDIISGMLVPGISDLCESHISKVIQDYFINIGRFGGGPALIWRFGGFLLDNHIGTGREAANLIDQKAFASAQLDLFNSLLESNVSVGDYVDSSFNHKTGKTIASKPKATIFLHYIEDDREIVTHILYQALLIENYHPWMECFDIIPGQKRDIAISGAIESADFVILCFSSESVAERGEFQAYLKKAIKKSAEMLEEDIYLIPFRLDDCDLPGEIKHLQHFDRFEEGYVERLYLALKRGLANRKVRKK